MRIGLLTYHASTNPGAFWQCFATCQLLRRLGHEPIVVDYRNEKFHPHNPFVYAKELRYWAQPRTLFRIVRVQFRHRRDLRMLPVSEPTTGSMPKTLALDALVVGSDVVWRNPFDPVFFGQILTAPRMVAYAVSLGKTPADSAPVSDFLMKQTPFHATSCRDANTLAFLARCHSSWSSGATILNDPTVTLDVPSEMRAPIVNSPYCILYVSRSVSRQEVETFKRFCTRHGWMPVSLFYPHPGLENHPFASARVSMRLFLNASMVVTDAFHGAVLSRIHGVPVVFMARNGVLPLKTREQFSRLGLSDCIAPEMDLLDQASEIARGIPDIASVLPSLSLANVEFMKKALALPS